MPRPENDVIFAALRAPANELGEKSKKCFRLSREARQRGDTQTAEMLSLQGKAIKEEKMEADKEAAAGIFNHINQSDKVDSDEIDLHGLYVPEAIQYLEQRIAATRMRNEEKLIVIVGKGQKIKPAVIKYANSQNIVFTRDPRNLGRINLHFAISERVRKPVVDHPEVHYPSRPAQPRYEITHYPSRPAYTPRFEYRRSTNSVSYLPTYVAHREDSDSKLCKIIIIILIGVLVAGALITGAVIGISQGISYLQQLSILSIIGVSIIALLVFCFCCCCFWRCVASCCKNY